MIFLYGFLWTVVAVIVVRTLDRLLRRRESALELPTLTLVPEPQLAPVVRVGPTFSTFSTSVPSSGLIVVRGETPIDLDDLDVKRVPSGQIVTLNPPPTRPVFLYPVTQEV